MLIVAINHSVLSTVMYSSFFVPMTCLSLTGSTNVFNKMTKVVTFQLTNDKPYKVTKRQFAPIVKLSYSGSFYEVTNEHIAYMFNEMSHQPPLTTISHFRKSAFPYVWNFLFSIFLRCLNGHSSGIDKEKLEVYAMIAGLYYDLNVDYVTQLWEEYCTRISPTNVTNGVSYTRY